MEPRQEAQGAPFYGLSIHSGDTLQAFTRLIKLPETKRQ